MQILLANRARVFINELRKTETSKENKMAIKIYGLAIEKAHSIQALALAPMTLAQAESARDKLAFWGKTVLVINLKSE